MSGTLNPLSYPKGQTFECEICGKPAVLQCMKCQVTFYCTREHQEVDAKGIHDKICPLLGPLRSKVEEIGSEEDRRKRDSTINASRVALVELTGNEAAKFLVSKDYELAVPAALQAMRFSLQVYGEGHIDVVPAYLLLAEANLGLGKHHMAEEFLSMANWSVLKNPDCSHALRSKVHRNFGKLYAAQSRHEEALKSLAQDVYHSSLEMGPEHIDTAEGYYHMASVFHAKDNVENALALFDKVVDIWYNFLVSLRNSGEDAGSAILSDSRVAAAEAMLETIAEKRQQFLGPTHIATGEVQYTIGLLQLFQKDTHSAETSLKAAGAIYTEHLGADHPSTKDVEAVLAELAAVVPVGIDSP